MKECKYCKSSNVKVNTGYDYHNILECQDCNLWTIKVLDTCCRNPMDRYVSQQYEYNISHIHIQCDNCGGCLNMKKPLKHSLYGSITKGNFSEKRFTQFCEEKRQEHNELYKISVRVKFEYSILYKYHLHLQSDYWRNIRSLALERDNQICQSCKIISATEVHHLTYDNLGHESLDELISFCNPCHKKIHGLILI